MRTARNGELSPRSLAAPLSYPEVGATATALPPGYHHVRVRGQLGHGRATFDRAADLLLSWGMHERAGTQISATSPVVAEGVVVVQRIGVGRLRVAAGCRVVSAHRSERSAGFTYGTLAGHLMRGEEQFELTWLPDDSVVAAITAFDGPGRWFVRLAPSPLRAWLQSAMITRYLRALRSA